MGEIINFPGFEDEHEMPPLAEMTDNQMLALRLALMSSQGGMDMLISSSFTLEQHANYMKSVYDTEGPPWPWETEYEELRIERKIQRSKILSSARWIIQKVRPTTLEVVE